MWPSVTFPFISTVWCSRQSKPYILWKLIIWWWQWPRPRVTKRQYKDKTQTKTNTNTERLLTLKGKKLYSCIYYSFKIISNGAGKAWSPDLLELWAQVEVRWAASDRHHRPHLLHCQQGDGGVGGDAGCTKDCDLAMQRHTKCSDGMTKTWMPSQLKKVKTKKPKRWWKKEKWIRSVWRFTTQVSFKASRELTSLSCFSTNKVWRKKMTVSAGDWQQWFAGDARKENAPPGKVFHCQRPLPAGNTERQPLCTLCGELLLQQLHHNQHDDVLTQGAFWQYFPAL